MKQEERNEELAELEKQMTEEQILFCKLYVTTSSSNKECYMTAFPKSSPKSAEANSSRLLKNEKVKRYINLLLDDMSESVEISGKEIIRELKRIAFNSKNDNAKIKALTTLGELVGLFGEKEKVTNNIITISVQDKDDRTKQIENKPNEIAGCTFEIIDEDNEEK